MEYSATATAPTPTDIEHAIRTAIKRAFRVSDKKIRLDAFADKASYNIIVHDGKSNCIDMTYFYQANDIFVNHIDRCKFFKGAHIVARTIQFMDEMGVRQISLQDKSTIDMHNCTVPLSYYYILLNGMSWYNKLGFVSRDYQDERDINARIPDMSLNEFKRRLIQGYKQTHAHHASINDTDDFGETITMLAMNNKDVSPSLTQVIRSSNTIRALMQHLVADVHEHCLFLQCIVFLSSKYVIKYNINLRYVHDRGVNGGSRRKQTRRRRKKSRRRSHHRRQR